ncbi:C69 family dipeptidase [Secundilactobacillus kimchicus]|uniref:C69 family dipeptidase n=1 Tax=Secundilactobacillus kimchicus TaxID=528209 RepID=UPI0024A7AD29|nr:C69 family dipeptidase [Secundilactobacillus kimchicus]
MLQSNPYSACTSILIGRKASIDGSVMIGRNEDSRPAWPKHFIVHPAKISEPAPTFTSNDNNFSMPLPTHAAKYTATPEWTDKFGVFEEDGINAFGVAMSATESTYANQRVLAADPLVKDGIGEEAMVTVTLPYIDSARAGVKRLGAIVSQYGTCESNGILFADQSEAWYMETGSGHYWVAQRIPDDSYAVVANQMAIQEIDFNNSEDFMWHPDIERFVTQNHLNPNRTGFNFRQIFGTQNAMDSVYNLPRVWYGQKCFNPHREQAVSSSEMPFINQAEQLLSLTDARLFLGSHYQQTVYDPLGDGSQADKKRFRPVSLAATQESHILQLRPFNNPAISGLHWLAMGVTAQSVFVPFYAGIEDTPAAYKLGTKTYQPESAYWVYKQAGVLVDAHYKEFGPLLHETQQTLTRDFDELVLQTDQAGQTLSGDELTHLLTNESRRAAEMGLKAYKTLTAKLITQATALSPLSYHQDLNL